MKSAIIAGMLTVSVYQAILAQSTFFGVGWNQTFGGAKGINNVIQQYNDSRSYLEKPMDKMGLANGISIYGMVVLQNGFVGLGYFERSERSHAWGVDATQVMVQRDLRSRYNTVGIDFGIGKGKAAIGATLETGFLQMKTRVAPQDEIKQTQWEKAGFEVNFGTSLFAQFLLVGGDDDGGFAVVARPYLHLPFMKNDWSDVDLAINPATYGVLPEGAATSRPLHFGVCIYIGGLFRN